MFDRHISPQIKKLENGLEIITQVRKNHPVAAIQVWCRAGSLHEGNWLGAGLSHVLEHMLFKGTETRPPGKIDQEIQDVGGNMNAYTSFDHTVYYINVPSEGVPVAIDILCDITQNATLPDEELESEKDVILREMDMLKDDPGRRSSRRLFETAYSISPLRYPIIGLPDIYNQVTREDVFAYYRKKYIPNNLFFVIVGDIDEAAVVGQIEKHFSQRRATPLPPDYIPNEPAQFGPRRVIEEGPFQLGHSHLAFQVPGVRHRDHAPLELLSNIIGHGRSSRLNQRLREKLGVVHGINSWYYCPNNEGLFAISSVIEAANLDLSIEEIFKVIRQIQNESVTRNELEKSLKQQLASILSSLKTVQGIAEDLGGSWLLTGELDYSRQYMDALRRTTTDDIRRVAQEHLIDNHSSLYALLPNGSQPETIHTIQSTNRSHIEKAVLANGLTLLTCEDSDLPFVEVRWVTRGGVLLENAANQGISQLISKVLGKGTKSLSSEQIADQIESTGGSLDPFSGNNTIGASLECLNSDWASSLDLLADVMLHPSIPDDVLTIERQSQLAAIKSQKDQLVQLAFRWIGESLCGNQSYGLNASGTQSSVSSLERPHLLDFHDKLLAPSSSVLAIYGDIRHRDIRTHIESLLSDWHDKGRFTQYPAPPALQLKSNQTGYIHVDKTQAVVAIGFQGTTIHSTDKFALELLQEVYSDLGSRLFTRIRDDLGLAYYVSAYHFAGIHPGVFAFYAGTSPDQSDLVADEFLSEIHHVTSHGITQEELHRALAKILGQKKINAQSIGSMAMTAALDELYGLGHENYDREIEAYTQITLDDIRQAAEKYFSNQPHALVFVSPKPPKRPHQVVAP